MTNHSAESKFTTWKKIGIVLDIVFFLVAAGGILYIWLVGIEGDVKVLSTITFSIVMLSCVIRVWYRSRMLKKSI